MAQHERRIGGYVSDTERAKAVLLLFEDAGVPQYSIAVNDAQVPERAHRDVVAVQEGDDSELSPDDFSAFMRLASDIERAHPDSRFATDEERCLLVAYEWIDDEIMNECECGRSFGSEAGLKGHKQSCPQADDPEINKTMSDDDSETETQAYSPQLASGMNVHHNGGNTYTLFSQDTGYAYRVNLDAPQNAPTVQYCGAEGNPTHNEVLACLDAATDAGPEYREGPQESLHVTVGNAGAGNASSTTSSDGSDDSDSGGSADLLTSPGEHDYDEDELVEAVDDWLSYKADDPTSDLIDGAWDLSFKKFNDPNSGTQHGVYLESDPWHGPHWDSSSSSWDTDDGERPDEWADHSEAWRGLVSDDDAPINGIREETEGDYDDWHNYVPADEAEELA